MTRAFVAKTHSRNTTRRKVGKFLSAHRYASSLAKVARFCVVYIYALSGILVPALSRLTTAYLVFGFLR
ncbi:MAG: hypothetical protein U0165_05515 [Polyangiaceae bacterium]